MCDVVAVPKDIASSYAVNIAGPFATKEVPVASVTAFANLALWVAIVSEPWTSWCTNSPNKSFSSWWALLYKTFALLKKPASPSVEPQLPITLWKPNPPPVPFPEIPSVPPQVPSAAILNPVSLVAFPTENTLEPLYPLYL